MLQEKKQIKTQLSLLSKDIQNYFPIQLQYNDEFQKQGKQFNCFFIFDNMVYIGTRNSKLYIYTIQFIKGITFTDQKFINPNCSIVSGVIANQKYIISYPETFDQSDISVWNSKSRMFVNALIGHRSQINKVIFLHKQNYIASASIDNTIRIWHLQNVEQEKQFIKLNTSYPVCDIIEMNEQNLLYGGYDCYLVQWNWVKREIVKSIFAHAGSLRIINKLTDNYILTCGGDNTIRIWQHKKQLINEQIKQKQYFQLNKLINEQYESKIKYTKVGNNIFFISEDGKMFYYNSETTLVHKLKNIFKYDDEIVGIRHFQKQILIAMKKGVIKFYKVSKVNCKLYQYSQNQQSVQHLEDSQQHKEK